MKTYIKFFIFNLYERCSQVGSDILKSGGSAVDSLIAALLCDGVVNPYHSGIGGATFFTIYDKNKDPVFINCREIAPAAASKEMFEGNSDGAITGSFSIAVPGTDNESIQASSMVLFYREFPEKNFDQYEFYWIFFGILRFFWTKSVSVTKI